MDFKSLYFCLVLSLVIRGNFGRFYFCSDPGTPENAVRTTQFGVVYKFYIGSTIEYECVAGYGLRGASTITCNLLITYPFVVVGWKPDLPQCISKHMTMHNRYYYVRTFIYLSCANQPYPQSLVFIVSLQQHLSTDITYYST